ncbi:MAG: RNA methyltransferase [Lachnospiraceae bacterium]|nr:RNA methyltransferase [Lachnospiraceae bacterium]
MITSTANPQVKNLIVLNKKAKARKEQGVFIAEGRKMFEEAPKEWIQKVYVSESYYAAEEHKKALADTAYEVLSDTVFKAACDTQTPQGILTVVSMPQWNERELLAKENASYLLLESIQDPGNLGTMLRTGEGAGITAIIANKTTVDLYNPKTIRSTMGSIYRVPFLVVDDLQAAIGKMQKKGIKFYAAHLKGTQMYDAPNYKTSTAFLIGNEGNGLSDEIADLADDYIKIPMEGSVESLNAAIAATILMYEVNRQRRG